jgi:CRP-like cAMP-binding protein/CheY-like chemotaxis protein
MQHILVIEDNEGMRENIAEILMLSGYHVTTASNGREGVEAALNIKPDLIVCDIMMPLLDGYGVLYMLSKHPETSGIPFIFLTAKSDKSDFRKGMEMGADDYITKPFDGIELLNAVESRLKKAVSIRQSFTIDPEGVNDFIDHAQKYANLKLTSEEREVCFYKKKHILFSEGQRPQMLFFIISGKLKIYKINNDGKELITNIYGPNDFVGYAPILEETNYKDNAQVLEDAEIMLIPREDFMNLVFNDTAVARQFIKMIAHNIVTNEENLLNLAYNSLRKKVAYGLLQLFEKYRQEGSSSVVLNMSRENMAYVIGVATESLIRTLGDFKNEKLIDISGGKIIIKDEKRLKDLPY